MFPAVLQNVRSDDSADLRDFAAGEAAAALEPLARVAGFTRAYAPKHAFTYLRGNLSERDRVDRLSRGPAKARVAPFPDGDCRVYDEAAISDDVLIAATPDAAAIDADPMIDPERAAAIGSRDEH